MIRSLFVILVLIFISLHPQKVFDPEECIGICLTDGVTPIEQTIVPDEWVQL